MIRYKLLIIDDDQAVLDFMSRKLGARYELVTTRSPGDAAALAREHRPDVIVCDVDMPAVDGGDISAALYADDETRDIPLLFLTALVSPEDLKQRQGQVGGRPAVSKSAPLDELVAGIDALAKTRP